MERNDILHDQGGYSVILQFARDQAIKAGLGDLDGRISRDLAGIIEPSEKLIQYLLRLADEAPLVVDERAARASNTFVALLENSADSDGVGIAFDDKDRAATGVSEETVQLEYLAEAVGFRGELRRIATMLKRDVVKRRP